MILKIGDALPEVTFQIIGHENAPEKITTNDIFANKKVVVFAVPGAFTLTCTKKHLPSYVNNIEKFKSKGIDYIVCIAVNDVYTMHAWGELNGVQDYSILMLSDGNAEFTKAVGMEFDASPALMGLRSRRYAMVVEDIIVKDLFLEEKQNSIKLSGADNVLKKL